MWDQQSGAIDIRLGQQTKVLENKPNKIGRNVSPDLHSEPLESWSGLNSIVTSIKSFPFVGQRKMYEILFRENLIKILAFISYHYPDFNPIIFWIANSLTILFFWWYLFFGSSYSTDHK